MTTTNKTLESCDYFNRKELITQISGALKNCIQTHGPITNDLIGSAVKNIIGELKSYRNSTARSQAEKYRRQVQRLKNKFVELIEFTTEGWSYADNYFVEKWGYKKAMDEFQSFLDKEFEDTNEDYFTRSESLKWAANHIDCLRLPIDPNDEHLSNFRKIYNTALTDVAAEFRNMALDHLDIIRDHLSKPETKDSIERGCREFKSGLLHDNDIPPNITESELMQWQRYASYCFSCAKSGEIPYDFISFLLYK